MSELVLRGRHNDHRVIEELLTAPSALGPRRARYIRRVVVDATAVVRTTAFAEATTAAAVQMLVDPQTNLLFSTQGADDSWAKLPFAHSRAVTLDELRSSTGRRALIENIVEFELDHGATAIIPPYLHLERFSDLEIELACALMQETHHYVREDLRLNYDVFPVVSIARHRAGLDGDKWSNYSGRVISGAAAVATGPFALGLSGSSKITEASLHKNSRIWRRAAREGKFIAWHAGQSGPLAVALGAAGYEVGMCASERYDVTGERRNRAPGNDGDGPRYTGAYIDVLGRSISLNAARDLGALKKLRADLACLDPGCCPRGVESSFGDRRRQHAVRSRINDLEALDGIGARGWRLHHLERRASEAAAVARTVRLAADNLGLRVGVDPSEYEATSRVMLGLLETARLAIA
ncbi:hypothetical protein [Nocardioides alkalitolerans]|uniref:hypothetical protein n=1 Tax=Nocardioides alkalitolerans TaxID=281714 RepID=UPI00040EEA55|nr:hypothetical protein [Nocardioides alkalitolerans]